MAQKKKTAVKSRSGKTAAKKPARKTTTRAAATAKPAVKRSAVKSAGTKKKAASKKTTTAKTTARKSTASKKAGRTRKTAVRAKATARKAAPARKAASAKKAPAKAKKAASSTKARTQKAAARKTAKPAAKTAVKKPAVKKPVTSKAAATAKANAKPAVKSAAQPPAAPAQKKAPARPATRRHGFRLNEFVVYPAHGVGRISAIEEQEIAGISLELFVISFEKDKMTLRVPTGKCESVGMRKLAEEHIVKRAMTTLKGKARIKRTMWSRRAQEYEAKINSGDLISIAEVVRDLYRSETQQEQSYSERQLYEAALDRMAREIAVIDKLDDRGAKQKITEILSRSARGRRQAMEDAEASIDCESGESDVKAA